MEIRLVYTKLPHATHRATNVIAKQYISPITAINTSSIERLRPTLNDNSSLGRFDLPRWVIKFMI